MSTTHSTPMDISPKRPKDADNNLIDRVVEEFMRQDDPKRWVHRLVSALIEANRKRGQELDAEIRRREDVDEWLDDILEDDDAPKPKPKAKPAKGRR